MLVVVLIVGQEVNGSKRWISLPGPLPSLQVSELAKVGLIFYMAAFMSRFTYELRQRAFTMWRPLAVLAVPASLLFLAPDFGGMVVYTVCVIGMLMMSGASLTLLLGSGGVLGFGAVMMVVMEPYRLARWTSFLDPWADQFATGYQLTQALIAFGRGHVTGTGLGNSVQKTSLPAGSAYGLHFCRGGRRVGHVGRYCRGPAVYPVHRTRDVGRPSGRAGRSSIRCLRQLWHWIHRGRSGVHQYGGELRIAPYQRANVAAD